MPSAAAAAAAAQPAAPTSDIDVVEQQMVALQQLPGEERWQQTRPDEEVERSLQRARLKVGIKAVPFGLLTTAHHKLALHDGEGSKFFRQQGQSFFS